MTQFFGRTVRTEYRPNHLTWYVYIDGFADSPFELQDFRAVRRFFEILARVQARVVQ